MRRFILAAIALLVLAPGVLAEDLVPERRLVVTRDVDFYGSDLQNLFDTTLGACETACLRNPDCKAFTFNTRSNACFPKSNISDQQPYEGAISAQVLTADSAVLKAAPQRAKELGFLTDSDFKDAFGQALAIGGMHPAGQWDVNALLQAAIDRRSDGDILNAMRWMGAVVSKSDAADHWLEYARLSYNIKESNSSQRQKYVTRAKDASVNAYLRSNSDGARVNALSLMAEVLEQQGRGRDMVSALRLASKIQPRDDIIAELDSAIAKYGFRVTEHRVDNDSANPRICAEFSEPLVKTGVDYATFVKLPDQSMAVQAEGSQLCIDGAEHGKRYQLTLREGLPAASGEVLIKDVALALYVRDRTPTLHFPGRAYVLPKAADTALPIETVNLNEVDLTLRRVSDRNLLRTFQNYYFGGALNYWEEENFAEDIAEEVWKGKGEVQNTLNRDMTTRLPMGEVLADQPAGVYALTAHIPGVDPYDDSGATQWFVLSDLGMTTLSGTDGLHVFLRGLTDAAPKAGVKLSLMSRANRILATAETDAQGYVRFDAGLTRGTGGAAPALVMAQDGDDDMAFLSLTDPAFDLSDRGVEGREAAPPIDTFLTTDRGAYRAGETVHATVLTRDSVAEAIAGLPVTAILYRPDGVEYARHLSDKSTAGGHVFALPVGTTAPRGTWRLDIKTDVDAPALASTTVLVEDFLPERIDFTLALPDTPIRVTDTPPLRVTANYLFGAPGADLKVEGTVRLQAASALDGFKGYRFGRYDESFSPRTNYLSSATTDAKGEATLALEMPEVRDTSQPLEAVVTVSVAEGSGRPVERRMSRILAPSGPMIGIKPLFDDVVPEGGEARLQVIAIGAGLQPVPMQVRWTMNKVETRYQWYQQDGGWSWEPITRRIKVASEDITLGTEAVEVGARVDWGHFELVVERLDGAYVASSSDFYAGWYAPADTTSTPDTLNLSLDKPGYRSGDTAQLRLVPRYAGTALISVMSNRLIEMKAVQVVEGENLISLEVTDDWGAGAYVSASVIRPMDISAGQNPARALGLSYAKIDPGHKQLAVTIEAPVQAAPRGALNTVVHVDGVAAGDTAYVTLAAVDLGILNLTGFKSPDPSNYYFGQRRLGMEIRDIYGRLIDGMNGAMGQVRSGGDAGNDIRLESPPPTEELVAFFSGPVTVGADGRAEVGFDLPSFNGTVRLMAVAWSDKGVGQAEADVLVRDPVVVTASLPRFLAPGDTSRMLLEIVHADGPAGRMGLDVTATGLALDAADVPSGVTLAELGKASFSLPIRAGDVGDHEVQVVLTTPDGKQLVKKLVLPVRQNDPEVSSTRRFALAAGDTFTLDSNVFAEMSAGTGRAILSAGPLSKLDAPGLLSALDRYPYGCTEQVASQAMPLLYFDQVAQALGLGNRAKVQERIDQSIDRILTRQASNGAFGLWRAESGDFWLDAYVSDFLSRARAEGYVVPDLAFRLAMDNLRNRINYAPDFDEGGGDIAYALMVLAREGAAAMGDLRYYADVKGDDFTTPIGAAQLGAALALYGDQTRADAMFVRATRLMANRMDEEASVWRADYGTNLRDAAGLLTLAAEAGSTVVDRATLANRIAGTARSLSTQESAWTLMAARALMSDPATNALSVNGVPITGPLVQVYEAQTAGTALAIRNDGQADTDVTLTTFGVPVVAPEQGGYGYRLDRAYYTMEGVEMNGPITAGDRFVTVLTVSPFEYGEARLIINDPLPAGFEIDNPNLLRAGDVKALDWLSPVDTEYSEFRSDRFLAAVNWQSDNPFQLAYVVRAISPGTFHHPAALVEDMYRPQYRAFTGTSEVVIEP